MTPGMIGVNPLITEIPEKLIPNSNYSTNSCGFGAVNS